MASLTINFTPTNPAPANGYIVKYRVIGQSTYTTLSPNPTGSPVVISNLLANTSYEGSIQSICAYGTSTVVPFEARVYSFTRSQSFTRQCSSGQTGSSVPYSKTYYSTISTSDAQQKGTNDTTFSTAGQANANTNGTCSGGPSYYAYRMIAKSTSMSNPDPNDACSYDPEFFDSQFQNRYTKVPIDIGVVVYTDQACTQIARTGVTGAIFFAGRFDRKWYYIPQLDGIITAKGVCPN